MSLGCNDADRASIKSPMFDKSQLVKSLGAADSLDAADSLGAADSLEAGASISIIERYKLNMCNNSNLICTYTFAHMLHILVLMG